MLFLNKVDLHMRTRKRYINVAHIRAKEKPKNLMKEQAPNFGFLLIISACTEFCRKY